MAAPGDVSLFVMGIGERGYMRSSQGILVIAFMACPLGEAVDSNPVFNDQLSTALNPN